jgi:uncharacterized membrane protein
LESTKRTSIKTVTWELFHLTILAGIIYAFTGEWEYATIGAIFYIAIESLGYFIHERLWAKFGKKVK